MECKHTRGPWKAVINGGDDQSTTKNIVVDSNGDYIADTRTANRGTAIQEANARIISAAPELLSALKNLTTIYKVENPDCDEWESYKKSMEAIFKAEGLIRC